MKVKIGTKIYDSEKEPIMLILENEEKEFISNMGISKKYCSYPDNMSVDDAKKFMKTDEEEG